MSTYLELVDELHISVGAAGQEPSTVTNLSGEAERLAAWVKRADNLIQMKWANWKYLRSTFDDAGNNETAAGVDNLAQPADLVFWDEESFMITLPGETDKNPIRVSEWDKRKGDVLDTTQGAIDNIILMPDNSLLFEPVPDGIYTIDCDYYVRPTLLAASGDISAIPVRFHQAILGRAMILYANFENAPEIKDQGEEIYVEQLALLENDQLPNQFNARFRTGAMIEVIAE